MFTKEDYAEYFNLLTILERKAICKAQDVLLLVEKDWIKKLLSEITGDEITHYSRLKGTFEPLLFKDKGERLNFRNTHDLGSVKIKRVGSDEIFEAYCINISEEGVYVEFEQEIKLPEDVELWIDFFDGRPAAHYFGKCKWHVKAAPNLLIGRIDKIKGE